MTLNIYPNTETLAAAFTTDLIANMPETGDFSLALSGGSTPRVLFQHWAENYRDTIDWSRIHLYWGDERCVPPDHADSNFRMTKELLLDHIEIPEGNIHRIRGEAEPSVEAARYGGEINSHLPSEKGWPVFDHIILGMGGDGHTASIFPDRMELLESEHICETAAHPESGQIRVSLTGKVINAARRVSFLITGKGKAEVLKEIMSRSGEYAKYPSSFVEPRGALYFYLDEGAASLLS